VCCILTIHVQNCMLNKLFKLPRNECIMSLGEKDTILNFHFIQGSKLHIFTVFKEIVIRIYSSILFLLDWFSS